MPPKFETEKIQLPRHKKISVKLSEADHEQIRAIYATGKFSYRKIAVLYKVSATLIYLIVNPRTAEIRMREHCLRKRDGRYYTKEKCTLAMRKYRQTKKKRLE